MDSGTDAGPDPIRVTPELLAQLQAGLLDDTTAARVRRHARTDPEAARELAGLDTVRRRLAHLGTDQASAPEVPAEVTARIGAALRAAPPPRVHSLLRPALSRTQTVGLAIGVAAAAAAAVVGVFTLTRTPGPAFPAGPTAKQITVAAPATFPVSDDELRAALDQPPRLGPLDDATRRASCLTDLGYSPTTPVLGGRELELGGRPGVLLLIPGNTTGQVTAFVVAPTCSVDHAEVFARTTLARR